MDKINELNDPENPNTFQVYKLTAYQERIVSIIKQYPGINQKELAIRTGLNRITLSNNLKRLMTFHTESTECSINFVYPIFLPILMELY